MMIFANFTELRKEFNGPFGECPHRQQNTEQEATKMRRVRNNTSSENTFNQGVEQIIREKVARPTEYRDYELNAILHKEQFVSEEISESARGRGYSVNDLMQELVYSHPATATQPQ